MSTFFATNFTTISKLWPLVETSTLKEDICSDILDNKKTVKCNKFFTRESIFAIYQIHATIDFINEVLTNSDLHKSVQQQSHLNDKLIRLSKINSRIFDIGVNEYTILGRYLFENISKRCHVLSLPISFTLEFTRFYSLLCEELLRNGKDIILPYESKISEPIVVTPNPTVFQEQNHVYNNDNKQIEKSRKNSTFSCNTANLEKIERSKKTTMDENETFNDNPKLIMKHNVETPSKTNISSIQQTSSIANSETRSYTTNNASVSNSELSITFSQLSLDCNEQSSIASDRSSKLGKVSTSGNLQKQNSDSPQETIGHTEAKFHSNDNIFNDSDKTSSDNFELTTGEDGEEGGEEEEEDEDDDCFVLLNSFNAPIMNSNEPKKQRLSLIARSRRNSLAIDSDNASIVSRSKFKLLISSPKHKFEKPHEPIKRKRR